MGIRSNNVLDQINGKESFVVESRPVRQLELDREKRCSPHALLC